jgi:hypothetical protein
MLVTASFLHLVFLTTQGLALVTPLSSVAAGCLLSQRFCGVHYGVINSLRLPAAAKTDVAYAQALHLMQAQQWIICMLVGFSRTRSCTLSIVCIPYRGSASTAYRDDGFPVQG